MLKYDFFKRESELKTTHFVWCNTSSRMFFHPKKEKKIDRKSTFASYRRNIFSKDSESFCHIVSVYWKHKIAFFLLKTWKYPVMVYISRIFIVRILTIFVFHEKIDKIHTQSIRANNILFFIELTIQNYCFDWFYLFSLHQKKITYTYWINMKKILHVDQFT